MLRGGPALFSRGGDAGPSRAPWPREVSPIQPVRGSGSDFQSDETRGHTFNLPQAWHANGKHRSSDPHPEPEISSPSRCAPSPSCGPSQLSSAIPHMAASLQHYQPSRASAFGSCAAGHVCRRQSDTAVAPDDLRRTGVATCNCRDALTLAKRQAVRLPAEAGPHQLHTKVRPRDVSERYSSFRSASHNGRM
jgi:hypothetical protein